MNDLEKICKFLDKGKTGCGNDCCSGDNYMCAKYMVKQYISKGDNRMDKKRLLLLKFECKDSLYENSYSLLVSMVSMAICALALLFSIVNTISKNDDFLISLFLLLALVVFCIILILTLNNDKPVKKYRPYILIAIEEIEKEM